MIYVEYKGSGHDLNVKFGQIDIKEFNRREVQWTKYLESLGWKLIRIVSSKDKLLSDDTFITLVNECKEYFNVLRNGIELILDEKIAKKEALRKKEAFTKGLSTITQKVNS